MGGRNIKGGRDCKGGRDIKGGRRGGGLGMGLGVTLWRGCLGPVLRGADQAGGWVGTRGPFSRLGAVPEPQ